MDANEKPKLKAIHGTYIEVSSVIDLITYQKDETVNLVGKAMEMGDEKEEEKWKQVYKTLNSLINDLNRAYHDSKHLSDMEQAQ